MIDRAEIYKEETGQMNNALAWFRKTYLGVKVKSIMIIPTKTVSRAAGFSESVQIMREPKLKKLRTNVKAFFNEFRSLDFSNLSETKIQAFLDLHQLSVTNLTDEYCEEPRFLK